MKKCADHMRQLNPAQTWRGAGMAVFKVKPVIAVLKLSCLFFKTEYFGAYFSKPSVGNLIFNYQISVLFVKPYLLGCQLLRHGIRLRCDGLIFFAIARSNRFNLLGQKGFQFQCICQCFGCIKDRDQRFGFAGHHIQKVLQLLLQRHRRCNFQFARCRRL